MLDKEINYIKDEKVRNSAKILVDLLPDYFFHIPASTTGKYHPKSDLGEGGLVRHSKAVVRIGYELLKLEMYRNNYTSKECDLIIFSLLFHDGLKLGLNGDKYTRADHPILMANFIKDNKDKLELTEDDLDFVCKCISSHMGEWNTDYEGNVILPKPVTKYEKFVHMCDYIASKKFLNIEFDKNNEIGD